MNKTILLTGATDGIGREAARMLIETGHDVLLHGRNPGKLAELQEELAGCRDGRPVYGYVADLSRLVDVDAFATKVKNDHARLDVLINNAGVYKAPDVVTSKTAWTSGSPSTRSHHTT